MTKLLKIQLKQNEIVMLCIVILVAFFGINFLMQKAGPTAGRKEVEAKIEVSKKKLADSQELYGKLSKRSPSSDGASAEYLDQYVLSNDRFSNVITGIVNSSKGKTFSLAKLSLEDQSVESGYKKMLYTLDAEASFIEIGKFLERLEDAPLLTEVSSVEINRIDNEMKRCRAHIKLYSYVRGE